MALERVSESEPQLILLDLLMPEMDGFEFLGELRARDAWQGIPVVVVTAKELTAEERATLSGSAQRVLEKGKYRREDLLAELRALVKTRTFARSDGSPSLTGS